MSRPFLAAAALFLLAASAPSTQAQLSVATNSPNGKPLSESVVAYTLDARLDTDKKTLDAIETLTYRNLAGQPLSTFPFHLYLNAFRPESSFPAEPRASRAIRASLEDDYPAEKTGGI